MDHEGVTTDEPISAAEQLGALGQAVITTDADGVVVGWNPAAEALYGWTAEEAIGHNISTLCVPDVAQEIGADIMEALRAGVPWSGGFPVRRRDGTLFPALVTDSGVYREGRLVGIVGVSTNLGAAVRPLLERAADAALVLRAEGTITYASPAVRQLFGWRDEELIGTQVLDLIHPDDRKSLARFLEDVGRQPGVRPAHEVRVRRGENWAWAELALTNFVDDPSVRGIVCNVRRSLALTGPESADQRVEELEAALHSRLVVEQAKGFLAGRDGIDGETALRRLRDHAAAHHQSVPAVADQVVSGELTLAADAG